MSAISREDVVHLAHLAHIEMSDAELDKMTGELDAIVGAIASVSEVASSDVPATSHPIPLTNVLREDTVGQTLSIDEVLLNAPDSDSDRFKVPAILDGE
ncbi:Asp-tRNA(Asn)/Glu-tRNA(Gln) amidotransferase subunit GatC [Glutamicibacter sp. JC586]|uniref:Asp-tRNA(Asn)/Glu-tRNA(Gln) amidotransferase subunit GatC n=1 Tax=Glutamicibacter TaxID=1742989 RepID=UPI00135B69CE|nr:Asp-tRNA(Asn)/Glu-tRNA(Gln) amidotransferase subunit GatC [Glutamicibacter sp. JC586]